ncbi:MAG: Ig-like domain-containing protein, partial [Muribaculaceae bacterium]|nr:Ig-like domain-containing protein [Muribaculaceae bacterium]
LTEGESATLTATVEPGEATDKMLTWASSDEAVATVSAGGEVAAVKAGEATITVTSSNGKSATCKVTVEAKVIEVIGVTLNTTTLSLTEGERAALTATVEPDNATDKMLTWISSDETVATVSAEGEVTALATGTAVITVTASNGMTAVCEVTVSHMSHVNARDAYSINVKFINGCIEILGLVEPTATIIYDLSGAVIWNGSLDAKNNTVEYAAKGIYIIKVGNTVVKLAIR